MQQKHSGRMGKLDIQIVGSNVCSALYFIFDLGPFTTVCKYDCYNAFLILLTHTYIYIILDYILYMDTLLFLFALFAISNIIFLPSTFLTSVPSIHSVMFVLYVIL